MSRYFFAVGQEIFLFCSFVFVYAYIIQAKGKNVKSFFHRRSHNLSLLICLCFCLCEYYTSFSFCCQIFLLPNRKITQTNSGGPRTGFSCQVLFSQIVQNYIILSTPRQDLPQLKLFCAYLQITLDTRKLCG